MAFWEELGKTITDKGKEATKKAKELTEVIQLKSQVSAEKTKIQEGYAAIGKLYYEEAKGSQEERYQETFSWVEDSLNRLKDLEEQLSQLEGNRVCAECGCKVAKEDFYCRRCGAPMAHSSEDFDSSVSNEEEEKAETEQTNTSAPAVSTEEIVAETAETAEEPEIPVAEETKTLESPSDCQDTCSTEIEEDL